MFYYSKNHTFPYRSHCTKLIRNHHPHSKNVWDVSTHVWVKFEQTQALV